MPIDMSNGTWSRSPLSYTLLPVNRMTSIMYITDVIMSLNAEEEGFEVILRLL